MDPKTTRLLIWIGIIAVLFLVFGKRLSGLLSGAGSALGGGSGGGGSSGGFFDTTPGTITAPGVTDTPTTATGASVSADGGPSKAASVIPAAFNASGKDVKIDLIPGGGGYLGAKGSTASDLTPAWASDQFGNQTFSFNVPGAPGATQAPMLKDSLAYSDFHANDSRVVAQIAAEKAQVAPGQTGRVMGYRQDGTPVIAYGR